MIWKSITVQAYTQKHRERETHRDRERETETERERERERDRQTDRQTELKLSYPKQNNTPTRHNKVTTSPVLGMNSSFGGVGKKGPISP